MPRCRGLPGNVSKPLSESPSHTLSPPEIVTTPPKLPSSETSVTSVLSYFTLRLSQLILAYTPRPTEPATPAFLLPSNDRPQRNFTPMLSIPLTSNDKLSTYRGNPLNELSLVASFLLKSQSPNENLLPSGP